MTTSVATRFTRATGDRDDFRRACDRVALLVAEPRFAVEERRLALLLREEPFALLLREEPLALFVRELVPARRPDCDALFFLAPDRDAEVLRVVAPRVAADLVVEDFLPDVPRVDFRVVAIPCSLRRIGS
jgi:hypothetical protein